MAGALDDGLVSGMTEARLRTPMAPKAALLHLLEVMRRRSWTPRWIVSFSSTSSLFGFHGQANYCAANALLDQMATWHPVDERTRLVTVNWGPWAQVGMAAIGSKAHEQALKDGELPLATTVSIFCRP